MKKENEEILLDAPAHTSPTKNYQALQATTKYLEELKTISPEKYEDCELVASKLDDFGYPYEAELNNHGILKRTICTINHNSTAGRIMATFHSPLDPEYFDLALYYIKECKSDRVPVGGKLYEPHDILRSICKFKAGSEVDQDAVFDLYQKAKHLGFETKISEEEALALFGKENLSIFNGIKGMTPEELKTLDKAQKKEEEEEKKKPSAPEEIIEISMDEEEPD